MEVEEVKNYGEIPLRNKKKEVVGWAKCSLEDFEELNKYRWYKVKNGYARTTFNSISVTMHKFVKTEIEHVEIPKQHVIDHINNDRIDNRRINLRLATVRQNSLNKKKRTNALSKYRGVRKNTKWGSFTALGNVDGKTINLGSSKSEEEAAMIYDRFCSQCEDFHEGFRVLNFPDKLNEYKNNLNLPQKKTLTSNYFGVFKFNKKFLGRVTVDKKRYRVCYSESELECAKAYDKFIYENKLDRKFNFPEDYPDHANNLQRIVKTDMKIVDEKSVELVLRSNKFGFNVIVDVNDYEMIKFYNVSVDTLGYAHISVATKKYLLHRYLLNVVDPSILIDHIDGNPSNCKRDNLRISTALENSRNKKKHKSASSIYYGVHKITKTGGYGASVKILQKVYTKRFYADEVFAARWRDLIILQHVPNSTFKMNFEWTPEEILHWRKTLNMN